MAQWVTLWRAAQLVGVPRGTLQQRVRAGEIDLTEGLLSTEQLLRLYPQAQLADTGMLERVVSIKDDAFGRRVRERLLPSQDVLAQRLFRQGQELADVQRHLQRYHALVVELRAAVDEAQGAAGGGDARLAELRRRIDKGLARVLATEAVDPLHVMDDILKMVSAEVTLRPSGRQFAVEGRDTLLQAGLKAGLALNYGCGNGSCGMCKVRVVSGEVAKVMPFDYPLSEAERQQGYTLMCAHTAASAEITVESLEASGPADIPEQQLVTTVRAVRELGADTRLLHLQTPRSHRLRFLAGQSVTLARPASAASGGDDLRITLPVASCPCDDRNLHFVVPREAGGGFVEMLFAGRFAVGEAINLRGPAGEFVLGEGARPLVFAACDTGFGPIKSLIEHALSLDAAPSLSLYWLATRPDGHFMANQCRAWSDSLDNFEYSALSAPSAVEGAREVAQAIRADQFDIDCAYYLAGPAAFVDSLGQALAAAGVPAGQIVAGVV